jgi:hypothetical protein
MKETTKLKEEKHTDTRKEVTRIHIHLSIQILTFSLRLRGVNQKRGVENNKQKK